MDHCIFWVTFSEIRPSSSIFYMFLRDLHKLPGMLIFRTVLHILLNIDWSVLGF